MADETRIIKIEIDTGPVEQAAISIKSLTDANKKLREERKLLDVTTQQGRASIEAINKSLDRNDALIKQNSSSLEKQRLNVGNYTQSIKAALPALDGMTGGAASAAVGMQSMTKSALAFIATPIGAIIGAIGLALGALTAYFKGSEEGQNRLNRIMTVGSVIFEKFMDVVEAVGKKLFEAIIEPFKLVFATFERFFPETAAMVKDWVSDITDAADTMSSLEEGIVQKERDLVAQRAATDLKVAKLREQAAKSDGDVKKAYIEKAIALEQQLAAEEVKQAEKKLELARQRADINGKDIAALDAVRAAEAAVDIAKTTAFNNTLKMQKELKALADQELTDRIARLKAESDAKIAQQISEDQQLAELRMIDGENRVATDTFTAEQQIAMAKLVLGEKSTDEEAATLVASINAKKREEIDKIEALNKRDAQFAVALQASAFLRQIAGKNKALAVASVIIDTYVGAAKAISAYAAFPPLAAAMAAIIVAMGLANVAKIAGVKFAEGGMVRGPGTGTSDSIPANLSNGEFVVNAKATSANLGLLQSINMNDGGLAVNQATQSTNEAMALAGNFKSMIFNISWKEGLLMDDRIKFKEGLTTR